MPIASDSAVWDGTIAMRTDDEKRAEMENDRAHEGSLATLRSGVRKLAPIDTATHNSATSAAEAGAEQHVKIMLTHIVIVEEFSGMSRLCRV